MSAETPNPQPGDRVRVTFEATYVRESDGQHVLDVADGMGPIHIDAPAWATVEVLKRVLCPEIEGATGIRCQQPTGHVDGHKGTTTEQQTKAVGYPLFVSWPAEPERARMSVRVPNEPRGLPEHIRRRLIELASAGNIDHAVAYLTECTYLTDDGARAYVEGMSEYQTYLAAHGRTEVDEVEADRMRAMGFDKQPDVTLTDVQRADITEVLEQRRREFHWSHDGQRTLDMPALSGVVADIVWAAIRRDRERGDR